MKRILTLTFIFAAMLTAQSCMNSDADDSNDEVSEADIDPNNPPVMVFDHEKFDFGKVTQGEKVRHTYKFTNTGKSSLVLSSVKGSCGCTVPKSWPKKPIPPGGKGEIDVVFDSELRSKKQTKKVTILANTKPSKTVLTLTGFVLTPES
jgi:hypothetical protein